MCGIFGMIALDGAPLRSAELIISMADALRHRGPDGEGLEKTDASAIGVTRLRVIDLDPRADQPFVDPQGEVVLACNGEIYNAPELRRRYRQFPFRSSSDVETILPLYLEHGAAGLAELNGMFAIAIWDTRVGTLVLARDRAGEKPLFYARREDEVWFASELGALLAHHTLSRQLDAAGVTEFTLLGYVREPRTLLAGVQRVPSGSIVCLSRPGAETLQYWTPGSDRETEPEISELRHLIESAVESQVRADVPVGVFTSGGVDSSLLATLAARRLGPSRVHAFSVGFPQASYDERPFARRFAQSMGIPYTEVSADEAALRDALESLVPTGEPLADPAALPTLLLARAARQEVKVALSGEGADELFGGYPTYLGHRLAPIYDALPAPVRAGIRAAVSRLPTSHERVAVDYLLKQFVASERVPWLQRHLAWFGTGLPGAVLRPDWRNQLDHSSTVASGDSVEAAMRFDYLNGLRERLLVKVDRATMLASLEARAPFLDPDVSRAAWAVSGGRHVGFAQTKRILKQVARPWLPRFILRRRKRGLSVPIAGWINRGLAQEVDRMLDSDRLNAQGIFDGSVVAGLLAAHRSARANHARGLWALYTFQRWMEHWEPEAN